MIGTKLEFAYIKLCFINPQLWALKYVPIDVMVQSVVNLVYKYRGEFDKYPTYDTFLIYLASNCEKQEYEFIKKSFEIEVDDEFVMSKVMSFVESQRFKKGLQEADSRLSQGNLEGAKLAVIESMEMAYNLPVDYFNQEGLDWTTETVSTGYECFDKPFGGGGHRKNFALVIGPSSIGKSLFLLNMGAEGVRLGNKVLHITLENSTRQTIDRYKRRFDHSGIEQKGSLHIQEFPTGGATVADFDAVVNGYRPDILLIDYLNEVKAGNSTGNTSKDLGDIARGMRSLAQRYNNFVVTAQQGPKGKKFSEVDVTAEDGFWSYEPAQVADAVITLNQTLPEKKRGVLRAIIAKNRNGPDGLDCPFKVDYSNMLLEEICSR